MKSKLRFILTFILIFALVAFIGEVMPRFLNDAGTQLPAATAETSEAEEGELTLLTDPPQSESAAQTPETPPEETAAVDEDGEYDGKDELALYIHLYGHLPNNFVTKSEAEAAGWSGGSLEKYLPGKCIGGDRFGNREGLLPKADGRTWTECDVNTLGRKSRGKERIVFSNDGLIYYTADHYDSFELLYGEP